MTMGALDQWRRDRPTLHPDYPLARNGPSIGGPPDIASALSDDDTFAFHAKSLRAPEIIRGTQRTLFPVGVDDPLDFYGGIELMRLAVVGLRQIARHSGKRDALSAANCQLIGRLAIWLLREISPDHYEAYGDRWANTQAARQVGLGRADLDRLIVDPACPNDLGRTFVMKTEASRRFVPVSAQSPFNPWLWNRPPAESAWRAGYEVATMRPSQQADDGALSRDIIVELTALGTGARRYFGTRGRLLDEAVTIAAAIGAHDTPLGTDPALFSLAAAGARTAVGKPHLRFVSRVNDRVQRLGRRTRRLRDRGRTK